MIIPGRVIVRCATVLQLSGNALVVAGESFGEMNLLHNSTTSGVNRVSMVAEDDVPAWIKRLPDDSSQKDREELFFIIRGKYGPKAKTFALNKLLAMRGPVTKDVRTAAKVACTDPDFEVRMHGCGILALDIKRSVDLVDAVGVLLRTLEHELDIPVETRTASRYPHSIPFPSGDAVVGPCIEGLEAAASTTVSRITPIDEYAVTNDYQFALAYLKDKLGGKVDTATLLFATEKTTSMYLKARLLLRLGYRKDPKVLPLLEKSLEDDFIFVGSLNQKIYYIREAAKVALDIFHGRSQGEPKAQPTGHPSSAVKSG